MQIGDMTIYQILWYFMIYSVLGWCVEVAFHAVTLGKVINRGFLNGPLCPVYGCGMLAILMVFNSIEADMTTSNGIPLFLGGMVLTTAIELIAGWALDKLFHARWWDYSNEPFNLHGYICLRFSIIWGLGTVFVYRIIHPTVSALSVSLWPKTIGWILLAVLYSIFAVDLVVTVATVRGLNRDLEELDELRKKLRIVSDSMSEHIAENSIRTAQTIEKGKVQAALAKADLQDYVQLTREELTGRAEKARAELDTRTQSTREEISRSLDELKNRTDDLNRQYEAVRARLRRHPFFGTRRLLDAFPGAVHRDYNDLLKEVRERLRTN